MTKYPFKTTAKFPYQITIESSDEILDSYSQDTEPSGLVLADEIEKYDKDGAYKAIVSFLSSKHDSNPRYLFTVTTKQLI